MEKKIEEKDVTTRAVVGTFQVSLQLSQQRGITMTGHLYSDDTASEINGRIDLYQDALDRQFIRADIISKEAQNENLVQNVSIFVDKLEELNARQAAVREGKGTGNGRSNVKLSSQETEILRTGHQSIDALKKQIVSNNAAIAAARKKLNGTASA